MTQIVDLSADVRWSETDIVNRMEALIREHCPATEELILHRKMIGSLFGFYTLTDDELAEVAAYAQVCGAAQLAGRQARTDAALLHRVLDAEAGIAPLDPADADGFALLEARAAARPPEPEPAPVEPAVDAPAEGGAA